MEADKTSLTPKDDDNVEVGDTCPQKKTWPVIEMTPEEKKSMTEPAIRSWGPFG